MGHFRLIDHHHTTLDGGLAGCRQLGGSAALGDQADSGLLVNMQASHVDVLLYSQFNVLAGENGDCAAGRNSKWLGSRLTNIDQLG
jgi:hypothetical protein